MKVSCAAVAAQPTRTELMLHATSSKRAIAALQRVLKHAEEILADRGCPPVSTYHECKCMRMQLAKERATARWRAIGHVYRNSQKYRCLPVITLDREEHSFD